MDAVTGNAEKDLDRVILEKLGRYVYALRDPRDRKVFYIGKAGGAEGRGNERVFDHFDDARALLANPESKKSAKLLRIIEIWAAGESVEWFIVRHGLSATDEAAIMHIEAALIDLLEISQNGPALNIQKGHHVAEHGLLSADDVRALAAPPVTPTEPRWLNRPVFIFPVHNAIERGQTPFDATRGDWVVAAGFKEHKDALAVGVAQGLSVGAYEVCEWKAVGNLFRFEGDSLGDCELHLRNYLDVIDRAKGFWMRGNYLVVEFLPGRRIRFLRGSSVREVQEL